MKTLRKGTRALSREGIILLLVLSIAGVLLIVALAVLRVNSDDVARFQKQMAWVQAQYIAKGGLNLALLKAQAMPKQLHDAVSFRVGRNPYFPHGGRWDPTSVAETENCYSRLTTARGPSDCTGFDTTDSRWLIFAGPAFFTGVPGTPAWNRTNTDTIPGANANNNSLRGDYDGLGVLPRVTEYVSEFRSDLCDANVVANLALGGNLLKPQASIVVPARTGDPFFGVPDPPVLTSASFLVTDIASYGTNGMENSQTEVLRIQIRARITTVQSGTTVVTDVNSYSYHNIARN
jgi:hypothetical protein